MQNSTLVLVKSQNVRNHNEKTESTISVFSNYAISQKQTINHPSSHYL